MHTYLGWLAARIEPYVPCREFATLRRFVRMMLKILLSSLDILHLFFVNMLHILSFVIMPRFSVIMLHFPELNFFRFISRFSIF